MRNRPPCHVPLLLRNPARRTSVCLLLLCLISAATLAQRAPSSADIPRAAAQAHGQEDDITVLSVTRTANAEVAIA